MLPVNRPKIIDLNQVMKEGFTSEAPAAPLTQREPRGALHPADGLDGNSEPANRTSERSRLTAPRALPIIADIQDEPPAPAKKSRKLPIEVLIVEDNDVSQIVYDQIMSNCGYHYLIVSSGEEGVNTALRERPRLVLMDISMPGLNGLEATKRIRQQTNGGRRPVIVGMTSHLLNGDKEKCLSARMDDYSLKPSTVGPLRVQIAGWLGAAPLEAAAG